jgi:hypothetical protein
MARRFVRTNLPIAILACLLATGCSISIGGAKTDNTGAAHASETDPLNATYMVDGQSIRLFDGRNETKAAPGSATKIITSVFGRPVYGNIDGKGGVDAALFLTLDQGGSGTFYYLAASLCINGFYRGTRAVLLGDRVAPQEIIIRNGVIVANYADRKIDEPMTAAPSVGISRYLLVEGDDLKEVAPFPEGEEILEGWVTIGHEVRSFAPCSRTRELWLAGGAPALDNIMAAYRKALPTPAPYTPLFMTLAGKTTSPPSDGFGSDYDASFSAIQLVQVFPQGNCKSDLIYMDSPLPGTRITAPLIIRGHARRKWFFEGDFPIVLLDANGTSVAQGYAKAKGAWMTEMFVPFESLIDFKPPSSGSKGTVILKKDNPTGKPEFDDALEIPINFK